MVISSDIANSSARFACLFQHKKAAAAPPCIVPVRSEIFRDGGTHHCACVHFLQSRFLRSYRSVTSQSNTPARRVARNTSSSAHSSLLGAVDAAPLLARRTDRAASACPREGAPSSIHNRICILFPGGVT